MKLDELIERLGRLYVREGNLTVYDGILRAPVDTLIIDTENRYLYLGTQVKSSPFDAVVWTPVCKSKLR